MADTIREFAAEFGFSATTGMAHLVPLPDRIRDDKALPTLARDLFAAQAAEFKRSQDQIDDIAAKLAAWHKSDELSLRLAKIPGVGPLGASLLVMKTPMVGLFGSGRDFAA